MAYGIVLYIKYDKTRYKSQNQPRHYQTHKLLKSLIIYALDNEGL